MQPLKVLQRGVKSSTVPLYMHCPDLTRNRRAAMQNSRVERGYEVSTTSLRDVAAQAAIWLEFPFIVLRVGMSLRKSGPRPKREAVQRAPALPRHGALAYARAASARPLPLTGRPLPWPFVSDKAEKARRMDSQGAMMCCSRGAVATEGRCGPGRRGRRRGHSRPCEAPVPFTPGSVKPRYINPPDN